MRACKIMEVCGTHTMSIAKAGLKKLLPPEVELISGPGCPVCVTPASVIDAYLELAMRPDVIITSYGDMLKVPGSVRGDNLAARRARGADVRIVFSPMDAIEIAEAEPSKEIVFLGAGFETTAPGTAASVVAAAGRGVKNFSVLCMLRTIEPAIRALYAEPDFSIDAFLCPGHVATIIGETGFEFIPRELGLPAVISGFDGEDILISVSRILKQLEKGEAKLENEYTRAVARDGNALAKAMIEKCLEPCGAEWRGLGTIPASGLRLREEYAAFDAEKKFGLVYNEAAGLAGCRCGDVICGRIAPRECPLFGSVCTAEDPVGPCMVSSEGACAAEYKYGE